MPARRLAPALLACLLCACAARTGTFTLGPLPTAGTPADWIQKGDELEQFIYRNTRPWRIKMAGAKSGQVKAGLTSAALGALGGSLTGAIKDEKTAKWVGVGMSTATTVTGLVATFKALGDDTPGCIRALDQATTAWDIADKSTEASARVAYQALRTVFGDQAQRCPELGDQFTARLSARAF